jgi:multiple sugar transport system ATP-binding protein
VAKVVLRNLVKRYGEIVAVNNINLEIEEKEFIVLVGPSGCGKTTTLRMIAGLEDVTQGEIYIGGRFVNDVAPKDRNITMVFQSYALYPHLNVYKNIAFGLKLRRTPREEIDARVKHAAEILGISDLLTRKPRQLSGGQRQRVALGRAIVRQPEVFLFDEPLSNLDAKLRANMRSELIRLHDRLGATMIHVTHDQLEAMTMGDRIVVMNDGVIQQVGTPIEVYNHPANLFVAGFIGSPEMNFFRGDLVSEDGKLWIDLRDFRLALPPEKARACERRVGSTVIFGIRPEHISDHPGERGQGEMEKVEALVEVMEPVGSEIIVDLATERHSFVARMEQQTHARMRATLPVYFDMRHSHVFDPQTEQVIA